MKAKVKKMKKAEEVKVVNEFKVEPVRNVIQEKVKEGHGRGRLSRFPLMKIKRGFGLYLAGTKIAKISPLVHYYNSKHAAHLRCKTIDRDGGSGIFVYNPKVVNKKEMAAAA